MTVWIIQRILPGRIFVYYRHSDDGERWIRLPAQSFSFSDQESAEQFIRSNKRYFDPDDHAVRFVAYEGKTCPLCMTDNIRHVGTAREPRLVTIDLQCARCGWQWQDYFKYHTTALGSIPSV